VYRVSPGASSGSPFAIGATTPFAVEVDPSGTVWVATRTWPGHVIRLSSAGAYLGSVDVGGEPVDIEFDAAGNAWVSNNGSSTITKLSSAGAVLATYSMPNAPAQIAFDGAGNLWAALYGNGNGNGNSVVRLSSAGAIVDTRVVGWRPVGLHFDAAGNLWTTLEGEDGIAKITPGGVQTTYPCGNAPRAFALDAFGNPWVCSMGTGQVLKVSGATGATVGTYNVGGTPASIAFDGQRAACVTVPSLNKLVRLAL
jgi:streptogramin lyase